jgi:hypothetical protein
VISAISKAKWFALTLAARGPMTEPANSASRPWTYADDDKLRRLALAGFSVQAIGIRLSRTETGVCSRARRLQVILRKIKRKQLQMG